MNTEYDSQKPQRQFQPQGLRLPQHPVQPQAPYSPPSMPYQNDQLQAQSMWQQPQMPPPMASPGMQAYSPLMTPSVPKKKHWYRQAWNIALIGLLLLALCGGIIAIITHVSQPNRNTANSKSSNTTASTTLPQATPASTQSSHTTATKQTNSTSTSVPGAFAGTHGTPRLGGSIRDFVGKYGQPTSRGIGTSENFYTDSTKAILVNVSTQGQDLQVQVINIHGQASWSTNQTKAFCAQFLPSDAMAFNTTANFVNYHSSVGTVVLTMPGQGTCALDILS